MKVKCEYCGDEFEAKRSTAKYCPGKPCKAFDFRAEQARQRVSVTEQAFSVTDPRVSVTPYTVSVTTPDELVTLRDTFYGHHIKVGVVPLHWQADKQAAALVKAKIPHYPTEAVDGRYDRDKVAEIW